MLAMELLSRCWTWPVRVPSPTVRLLLSTVHVPLALVRVPPPTIRIQSSTAKVSSPIVRAPPPTVRVPLIL
jgi:hypothetical protein